MHEIQITREVRARWRQEGGRLLEKYLTSGQERFLTAAAVHLDALNRKLDEIDRRELIHANEGGDHQ